MNREKQAFIRESRWYSWVELLERLWSGGKDNALLIDEAGLGDRFMELLQGYIDDDEDVAWELRKVNDFLWFDFEIIARELGLNIDEEEEI